MDNATSYKQQIGHRLRNAIEAVSLKQKDAAELMGVSPSKLNNWLRGDNYPDPFALKLLCDRYNITADYIYREQTGSITDRALGDALWKMVGTSRTVSKVSVRRTRKRIQKSDTRSKDGNDHLVAVNNAVWNDFFDAPGVDLGERVQSDIQSREHF